MATPFETQSAETIQAQVRAEQARRRPNMFQYIRYYLGHKPLGTVGFSIVLFMILLALFAPLIAPYTVKGGGIVDHVGGSAG